MGIDTRTENLFYRWSKTNLLGKFAHRDIFVSNHSIFCYRNVGKGVLGYVGENVSRGGGLSHSSILIAEKVSEELSKRLGGESKEYFVIDDAFIENKPKKFVWQTMQYQRWLIFKQLERK